MWLIFLSTWHKYNGTISSEGKLKLLQIHGSVYHLIQYYNGIVILGKTMKIYGSVYQPARCWLSSALDWTVGWWRAAEYTQQNKCLAQSEGLKKSSGKRTQGKRKRRIQSDADGAERWTCELKHWRVAECFGAQTPIREAKRHSQQNSKADLIVCSTTYHFLPFPYQCDVKRISTNHIKTDTFNQKPPFCSSICDLRESWLCVV